ncbi:MAG: hypothetical protein JO073_01845 [Actinobacteria bacterium]|nr:hypothetical protein [Actinomycetota bacterium]
MPTRKQRRREAKSKRHEYEFVYVDDEGHELDEPPDGADEARPVVRRNGTKPDNTAQKKKQQPTRGGRAARIPQPPSWQRAAKRALFLGVVVFVLFYIGGKGGNKTLNAAGLAALYTLLFIPFTYFIDRFAYQRYQRREQGGAATPKKPKR